METCVTYDALKTAYNENEDFKNYVDAYATSRSKNVDNALKDKVVEIVYKQYMAR